MPAERANLATAIRTSTTYACEHVAFRHAGAQFDDLCRSTREPTSAWRVSFSVKSTKPFLAWHRAKVRSRRCPVRLAFRRIHCAKRSFGPLQFPKSRTIPASTTHNAESNHGGRPMHIRSSSSTIQRLPSSSDTTTSASAWKRRASFVIGSAGLIIGR